MKTFFTGLLQSIPSFSVYEVTRAEPLGGGCINDAFKLETVEGAYFCKINTSALLDMFEKEALGLKVLQDHAQGIYVPKVLATGVYQGKSFLLLEYISSAPKNKDYWSSFGVGLANFHLARQPHYGFQVDNYIGKLPQSNKRHTDWISFFIEERITPQLKIAYENRLCGAEYEKWIDQLRKGIEGVFPDEPPALMHGDLWSGNTHITSDGDPSFIDPAPYGGLREMELAFTEMFGGFDRAFYNAYQEVYPLASDYRSRVDLLQLYPYLVHANLFGASYWSSCIQTIRRYAQ